MFQRTNKQGQHSSFKKNEGNYLDSMSVLLRMSFKVYHLPPFINFSIECSVNKRHHFIRGWDIIHWNWNSKLNTKLRLELQVEYRFKLEFQVEQLIRWESVSIGVVFKIFSKKMLAPFNIELKWKFLVALKSQCEWKIHEPTVY